MTDGRAIFAEVGVREASGRYNIQGLYMGWNAAGQGEGHFIVNRGNGNGGFSWRSVNAGNTAGGPAMTYSYDGILGVTTVSASGVAVGTLAVWNEVSVELPVRGIRCRTGVSGAYTAQSYNFNWTGSNVDVYIGATYVGTMTLFGSDYRFKKYIKDAPEASYLDRIDAYRIVTYQRKNFGDVFKGDNVVYQGLIAHEAQEVNPLAVTGEKDGLGDDGQPRVQQLEPMALITDLMGAVKELRAELAALKAAQA
ncbi:tail fiber domain-containing protein [Pseudomonas fluorescens]